MIINEIVGQKVVVHVGSGGQVVVHRGVLEQADSLFLKLKKDTETIYFCMHSIVAIHPV